LGLIENIYSSRLPAHPNPSPKERGASRRSKSFSLGEGFRMRI